MAGPAQPDATTPARPDATSPARPDLGMRGFGRSLPMALLRAREAVMGRFRPILTAHGLTEQQWRVLRALSDGTGGRSVGALAADTFLLGPSLSRMLASLDERGLVVRRADHDDARRVEIAITRRGLDLVTSIAPASEAEYAQIGTALAPGELDTLYRLLHRIETADRSDVGAADDAVVTGDPRAPRRRGAGAGTRRPPR